MALRMTLVALVMSMGLDLPSGGELTRWSRSGRDWLDLRWAEMSGGAPPAAGVADRATIAGTSSGRAVGSVTSDIAFEVVVEGMATEFAADWAGIRDDGSGEAPSIAGIELPRASAWRDPEPALMGPDEPTSERVAARGKASIRGRVASAVRLTRQAAGAWTSLLVASDAGGVAGP